MSETSGHVDTGGIGEEREQPAWSVDRADQAADILWRAWQQGELIDDLPAACRPSSLVEGNSVQACLAERIGTRFGWKIAATSVAGQRHIAVDRPLPGRLFTRYVINDGGRLSISGAHMHMLVAEAEFAFRISADGESRHGNSLAADLHLAIELPDSRFARFETAGGPQLMADNACGSCFVLGPSVPGWQYADLVEQPVLVRVNGIEVASGAGRNVLTGPLNALMWLSDELIRYGEKLQSGDIVTTGVAALPVSVAAGDHVVAEFPSMGSVSVRIDP